MAQPQQMDIGQLPLEQLLKLQKNFEAEVQHLTQATGSLKVAANRFKQSASSLSSLNTLEEGNEIMVPLTGSLYCPGKLANPKKAVIDVGTGYFVEKPTQDAVEYFKRRIADLSTKIVEADFGLRRKQESLMTINQLVQLRMTEAQKQGPVPE